MLLSNSQLQPRAQISSFAITLTNPPVSSRLDYCNSFLRRITYQDLYRIQGIQKHLILHYASRYTSITLHLSSLSWLSISYRIVFKTCLISYKILHHGLLPYFSQLLVPYTSVVNTRRRNPSNEYLVAYTFDYKIHKSRHQFNACFSFNGPYLGNSLQLQVRYAESIVFFPQTI